MHHLWKISTEFKMAVLTLKLGIYGRANKTQHDSKRAHWDGKYASIFFYRPHLSGDSNNFLFSFSEHCFDGIVICFQHFLISQVS